MFLCKFERPTSPPNPHLNLIEEFAESLCIKGLGFVTDWYGNRHQNFKLVFAEPEEMTRRLFRSAALSRETNHPAIR
jgi:hypothetical protein